MITCDCPVGGRGLGSQRRSADRMMKPMQALCWGLGWLLTMAAEGRAGTAILNAHGGAWSCKLTASGLPVWAGPSQQVPCTPGRTYIFKVWLRGQGQTLKLRVCDTAWKE